MPSYKPPKKYKYLSGKAIIQIHDTIIKRDPITTSGILFPGLEKAASERPRTVIFGHAPYPDIFIKAASLMDAICRWHIFVDGNKRTSLAATQVFLARNDYFLLTGLPSVRLTVLIAQEKRTIEEIAKWLKKHSSRYRIVWSIKLYSRMVGFTLFMFFGVFLYPKYIDKKMSEWLAFDINPVGKEEWMKRIRLLKRHKRKS